MDLDDAISKKLITIPSDVKDTYNEVISKLRPKRWNGNFLVRWEKLSSSSP